jgi:hypothetical protein
VGGVTQACTPGAAGTESCNGVDDDCDGQTDESLGSTTCGSGACQRTQQNCVSGASQSCTPLPGIAETCNSVDDDCDGTVDDGVCGPASTCPAPQTVNPNTTVTLNTSATSPVGRPVSCQWTVASRPATSSGTFTAPTSCTSAKYFADVVGSHVLRFTVTDSLGVTSTCQVTITVNPLGDLWVELTWDKANDMDLHLRHPSAPGGVHSANGWSFNASGLDCYFSNKTPSWDAPGTVDDPSLDRDDITGKGPENIRINVPSTGKKFLIGTHMYSKTATNVTATVRVYCGGVLKTTQTKLFNTDGLMWAVGTVEFLAAGGCTFVVDGATFAGP